MQAYEKVQAARQISRPTAQTFIKEIFDTFIELHGDRNFADDLAIYGGIASLKEMPVTVIGIEKGKDTEEKVARNFGAAHPEGYRKALRLMQQAEKFGRPIVCFVDTAGAYCGIGAEERGQGSAIATNLMEMMDLSVPVISIIIGEGGSGGALALAVANEVWMLENAIYSVITPEGAASILYKDAAKAPEASEALRLTAQDLLEFGIIERIFAEQGGHLKKTYGALRKALLQTICDLQKKERDTIKELRYEKFRKIGSISS
ncbi:MAG: acetyl-CoA carboxylase carboxyltransferase subunit alpha [Christensenellaceae bacterium]|jgi:acetyl-CoA carboxylase carboxyl transferase subunit alpha